MRKTKFKLQDIIRFGKYKEKSISQIIKRHPKYIIWCTENIEWFDLDNNAWTFLGDIIMKQKSKS